MFFGAHQARFNKHASAVRLSDVAALSCVDWQVRGRVVDVDTPSIYARILAAGQLDILLDVDWRFWHLQFIPFLFRSTAKISYSPNMRSGNRISSSNRIADMQEHGVKIGTEFGEQENPFGRRLVLCHFLCDGEGLPEGDGAERLEAIKARLFPGQRVEVGDVLDFQATSIDVIGEDGLKTASYDKRHFGAKIGNCTQCPWLVTAEAWRDSEPVDPRQLYSRG